MTRRKGNLPVQEDRLPFETLLANISARFINLPADQIDSGIEDAQRLICECLDVDLCAVWQVKTQDQNLIDLTHLYRRGDGPGRPAQMEASVSYPWVWDQIRAGNMVKVTSLSELPEEAAKDIETAAYFGIKSNLTIPLMVGGGQTFGALGCSRTGEEREWPEAVVMQLQLLAQVFANAIQRKRMEGQLRDRFHEIEVLKEQLESENLFLREEVKLLVDHTDIVGRSIALKNVMIQAGTGCSNGIHRSPAWGNGNRKRTAGQGHPPYEFAQRQTDDNNQLCFASAHIDRKRTIWPRERLLHRCHDQDDRSIRNGRRFDPISR